VSGVPAPERLHGLHPVREALRARRRRLWELRVRRDALPELAGVLEAARRAETPIREVGAEELPAQLGGSPTQGVELLAGPLPEVPLAELARDAAPPRTLVALDGVEDPRNVGAIARAAEAAGAAGLVLTRRRAAPLSPAVARASAGAIEWLPVSRVPNLVRALELLKQRGFWTFGALPEDGEDLFALEDRILRGDRVLVLGAEGRGLRSGTLRALDHRLRVPLAGRVASLNVASAAAVVLFELARRDRLATSP
jgi:23S rRNA (guanosine2251-2'-O)-methyltransferase